MFTRTRAFALALMLLLTQQFGVLHGLSHARLLPARAGGLGAGSVRVTGPAWAAPNSTATQVATTAATATATDPTGIEPPADGLCQVCLLLLALGAAALPALLQWLAGRLPSLHHGREALPAWQARAGSPYLARAPPARPALT